MPFCTASVCVRPAPWAGSDEYTSSVLPPPLLLLPLPPPLLLLSEPPQAETPTAKAATRQPEAAIQREFKEPLLMGINQRTAIVFAAPSSRQPCQNRGRNAGRIRTGGCAGVSRACAGYREETAR